MAFSQTVLSPMKKAERISRSLGVYAGRITVSSYATTLVECTAITKFFKDIGNTAAGAAAFPHGIVSCVADGISESGFAFHWDATTGAFRCYSPGSILFSGSATGAGVTMISAAAQWTWQAVSKTGRHQIVGIEALANDAVGAVNFVAVGLI